MYEEFKDCLLSEAASDLAAAGNLSQLQRLLKLRPYVLMPSLLDVLAALPETTPVASYRHLLQARLQLFALTSGLCLHADSAAYAARAACGNARSLTFVASLWVGLLTPCLQGKLAELTHMLQAPEQEPVSSHPQPSALETQDTCAALQQAGEYGLLLATEGLARLFLGWRPPSASQVLALWLVFCCS